MPARSLYLLAYAFAVNALPVDTALLNAERGELAVPLVPWSDVCVAAPTEYQKDDALLCKSIKFGSDEGHFQFDDYDPDGPFKYGKVHCEDGRDRCNKSPQSAGGRQFGIDKVCAPNNGNSRLDYLQVYYRTNPGNYIKHGNLGGKGSCLDVGTGCPITRVRVTSEDRLCTLELTTSCNTRMKWGEKRGRKEHIIDLESYPEAHGYEIGAFVGSRNNKDSVINNLGFVLRTIYYPPPPSPPPPPPSPPPSMCATPICSLPPFTCPYNDGLLLNENSYTAVLWNERCGDEFWTQHAPAFDWATLNVVECIGSTSCAMPSVEQHFCADDCRKVGDCSFSPDLYAPMLVHIAQLRTQTLMTSENTKSGLYGLRDALTHFDRSALVKPANHSGSGKAIVHSEIRALGSMVSSLSILTKSGMVPQFNYAFYTQKLQNYRDAMGALVDALKKDVDTAGFLELYAKALDKENAALAGQESVTGVAQQQTLESIATDARGMQLAIDGLNELGNKMTKTADDLRHAVNHFVKVQRRNAIVKMCFDLATLLATAYVDPELAVFSLKTFQETLQLTMSSLKAIQSIPVCNTVDPLNDYGTGVAKDIPNPVQTRISSSTSCIHTSIKTSATYLLNNLSTAVNASADPVKGSPTASLQDNVDELDNVLPGLGTAYWEEYYTKTRENVTALLTCCDSKVSAIAQSYIDLLSVQVHHGKDYVTHATRYVSDVQQFIINNAQQEAHNMTRAALDRVYTLVESTESHTAMQEMTYATQITSLATQFRVTAAQLCQSYEYQATAAVSLCAVDTAPQCGGSKNAWQKLCSPDPFEVLAYRPCSSSSSLASEALKYLSGYDALSQTAQSVAAYVTAATWGGQGAQTIVAPEVVWSSLRLQVWDDLVIDNSSTGCCEEGPDGTVVCNKCHDFHASVHPPPPRDTRDCSESACGPTIYIPRTTWDAFCKGDSSADYWSGQLSFTIRPEDMMRTGYNNNLDSYNELLVKGMAAYVPGGVGFPGGAIDVNMAAVGQMRNLIHQHPDPACASVLEEDPLNLCQYTNHTFVGAPTTVVKYGSSFSYPNGLSEDGVGEVGAICGTGISTPVFYADRQLSGCGDEKQEACYQYCPHGDLSVFDDVDARERYSDNVAHLNASPYNFVSLYSTFRLEFSTPKAKKANFSAVDTIELGLWMTGMKAFNTADCCSMV